MELKHKSCQSCGIPFKNDPKGGGSRADGTLSLTYCSYCFENGKFTQPDFTAAKMQQFVKVKLQKMGFFHKVFAGFFVKGIPKLQRWRIDKL